MNKAQLLQLRWADGSWKHVIVSHREAHGLETSEQLHRDLRKQLGERRELLDLVDKFSTLLMVQKDLHKRLETLASSVNFPGVCRLWNPTVSQK